MTRASSAQPAALQVFERPGGGLREPGPPGSPMSTAQSRADVIATLHQLIETLGELSSAGPTAQGPTPSQHLPLLLDATEAAKLLSLSRPKVCDMANRGEISSIRIGRSLRIPRDPLLAWIKQRPAAASDAARVRLPTWAYVDRSREL